MIKRLQETQPEPRGDIGRREVVERQVSRGKQRVSGVDRLSYAPQTPDGWPVTADETLILNVVVDQREVVQEFERSSGGRRGSRITPDGAGGQQCQRGSQALAAIHGT